MATGGGKQPPFRTARAQRTVRPLWVKAIGVPLEERPFVAQAGGRHDAGRGVLVTDASRPQHGTTRDSSASRGPCRTASAPFCLRPRVKSVRSRHWCWQSSHLRGMQILLGPRVPDGRSSGRGSGGVVRGSHRTGALQGGCTSSIRQLLGAADTQTAHPATFSTAPAHQLLGSANAETTPARARAAAADRTQRRDATCEGENG